MNSDQISFDTEDPGLGVVSGRRHGGDTDKLQSLLGEYLVRGRTSHVSSYRFDQGPRSVYYAPAGYTEAAARSKRELREIWQERLRPKRQKAEHEHEYEGNTTLAIALVVALVFVLVFVLVLLLVIVIVIVIGFLPFGLFVLVLVLVLGLLPFALRLPS